MLAGKTVLVSAIAEIENWRLSLWLTPNCLALCEPPFLLDHIEA